MASDPKQEIDIARNLRTIEWLKTELVDGIAVFFRALLKNSEQLIIDALAVIVMTCYFLGKRLGITYSQLERRIEEKLDSQLNTDHQLEKWYGDISSLLHYFEDKKR